MATPAIHPGMNQPATPHACGAPGSLALDPVFREVWERSFDAMRILDGDGTILLVNDAFCRLVGKERSALVGSLFTVVYGEERRKKSLDNLRERFAKRVVVPQEEQQTEFWDGRQVWLEISHSFLLVDGHPPLLLSIFRDVSQRKCLEQRLLIMRESMEHSSQAIAWIDHAGTYQYANEASCRLVGLEEGQLVGKKMWEFDRAFNEQKWQEHWDLVKAKGSVRIQNSLTTSTGGRVEHELDVTYVNYDGNEFLMTFARDVTERRRSEQELALQKAWLEQLFENTSLGIAMLDAKQRVRALNPAFTRMFGFTLEDLQGKVIDDFVVPPTMREEGETLAAKTQRRELAEAETYRLRKDGSALHVRVQGVPIRVGDCLAGIYGIYEDITVRKDAEEALRRSEERFRTLVQNSQDIITIHDGQGRIMDATESMRRVLGYSPEEMRGQDPFQFIHPDDLPSVMKEFGAVAEAKNLGTPTMFRFRHSNGTWVVVETVGRNLMNEPGIRGIVLTTRDVSQRIQAEEAIRESEARFRAVVEQSADGIYLLDLQTLQVIDCNAAFCRMLGYSPEEVRELGVTNLVANDYSEINRSIAEVLTENRPLMDERIYRRKDASTIDTLSSSTVISYGGTRVICTIVRDITDRKKLERDREVLIKELQTALSNIRTLGGLIPICSHCKKIRDDRGYWNRLEKYLTEHSDATLSHGICPDCAKKLYPEVFEKQDGR